MNEKLSEVTATTRTAAILFTAYLEFLKMMLGNLFLLCAGSATALLAFVGTRQTTQMLIVSPAGVRSAIILFALGAAAAVLATGLIAYQENENSALREDNPNASLGNNYGEAGVFVMMLSAITFVLGCVLGALL